MTKAIELSQLGSNLSVHSGSVGIGTDSPSGKLNLVGSDSQLLNIVQDSGDLAIRLNDRNVGSAYIKVPDNSSAALAFETGGDERLRINSDGLVGIGTDNPNQMLEVWNGNIRVRNASDTNSGGDYNTPALTIINTTADKLAGIDFRPSTSTVSGAVVARIGAYNTLTGGLGYDGALTFSTRKNTGNVMAEKMRIDKDGNVGIGTNSPTDPLHIHSSATTGQIRIGGGNGANNHRVYINSSSTSSYLDSYGNGAYASFRIEASPLALNNTSGGNVGIGTDSPSNKLHIKGTNTVLRAESSSSYADIAFKNSTGTFGYIGYYNNDLGFYANSGSSRSITVLGGSPGRTLIANSSAVGGNAVNAYLQVKSDSQYNGIAIGGGASYCTIGRHASNAGMLFTANANPANLGGGTHDTFQWWTGTAGGGGPSQVMLLNTDGKLQIGPSTNGGPYNNLDLGSATANRGISFGGANNNYANIWTEYGSGDLTLGEGVRPVGSNSGWYSSYGASSVGRAVQKFDLTNGNIYFYSAPATTVATNSSVTTTLRFKISGDGNVDVGDLGPSSGNGRFNVKPHASQDSYLKIRPASDFHGTLTGGSAIDIRNGANSSSLPLVIRADDFRLWIGDGSASKRIRIGTNGYVGIGTESADEKLHIESGNLKCTRSIYASRSSSTNPSPAAGDWINIAKVPYGADVSGEIAVRWSNVQAPSCCHHGYMSFRIGSNHGPIYNYAWASNLTLLEAQAHNDYWFTEARLIEATVSGSSVLLFQVKSSHAFTSGSIRPTILYAKRCPDSGNIIESVTPAVDNSQTGSVQRHLYLNSNGTETRRTTPHVSKIQHAFGGNTFVEGNLNVFGNVIKPYTPFFNAIKNQHHTFTSGQRTVIANWTNKNQYGNHFNLTTGVFTAPVAGVYYVYVSTMTARQDSGDFQISIHKNGSMFVNSNDLHDGSTTTYMQTTVPAFVKCAANDTIDFRGYNSSGTSSYIYTGSYTHCGGYLIG